MFERIGIFLTQSDDLVQCKGTEWRAESMTHMSRGPIMHLNMHIRTHTHTNTNTNIHTDNRQAYTGNRQTRVHTYIHTRTRTHTQTHTHTNAHKHAHAHTHTHKRKKKYISCAVQLFFYRNQWYTMQSLQLSHEYSLIRLLESRPAGVVNESGNQNKYEKIHTKSIIRQGYSF